jgi:hypothetical protein
VDRRGRMRQFADKLFDEDENACEWESKRA